MWSANHRQKAIHCQNVISQYTCISATFDGEQLELEPLNWPATLSMYRVAQTKVFSFRIN